MSIRVIQIGTGKMSKYTLRYVADLGGEIVGSFDNREELIGKDLSYVLESENMGVVINDIKDLNTFLDNNKVDIAIIETCSFINDLESEIRVCVKHGVNVITTCEEAFFPFNSNPLVTKELDALAKSYNATIVGTGYQDIFWGNMITNIAASTHNITKIKGVSSYNVEDYGIALANAHGAGLTKEAFDKEFTSTNNLSFDEVNDLQQKRSFFPSYMWNVAGWLAKKLKLTITSIEEERTPVVAEEDLESKTLNMTIKKGDVRGLNALTKAYTKEGIILEISCIGKVYTKEEKDINDWTIYGEPTTQVINPEPKTVELTCADVANRIPDVIRARSGFITTADLPEPRYLTRY